MTIKYQEYLFARWVGDLTPTDLEEFINSGADVLILQCQDLYDSDDEFVIACQRVGSVATMGRCLYREGERRWMTLQ